MSLNNGSPLCGAITLKLDGATNSDNLYLHNASKDAYQKVRRDKENQWVLTSPGTYLLTDINMQRTSIVWWVLPVAGGIVICFAAIYIVTKKQHWFWWFVVFAVMWWSCANSYVKRARDKISCSLLLCAHLQKTTLTNPRLKMFCDYKLQNFLAFRDVADF